MEYGTICWDPLKIMQCKHLERIQHRAAKFTFRDKKMKGWDSLKNNRDSQDSAPCRKLVMVIQLGKKLIGGYVFLHTSVEWITGTK